MSGSGDSAAAIAAANVLGPSQEMPVGPLQFPWSRIWVFRLQAGTPICTGYDFNKGIDYEALLKSYATSGFQVPNLSLGHHKWTKELSTGHQLWPRDGADRGHAAGQIRTLHRSLTSAHPIPTILSGPVEVPEGADPEFAYPGGRRKTGCTIFLGYTSNMISSGLRESIRFLVEHNLVDVLVTSAGGVEEDFIKVTLPLFPLRLSLLLHFILHLLLQCLAPTYLGDFALKGAELRSSGINRIGNLLVPNSNYCKFEDWLIPILDKMLEEQKDG